VLEVAFQVIADRRNRHEHFGILHHFVLHRELLPREAQVKIRVRDKTRAVKVKLDVMPEPTGKLNRCPVKDCKRLATEGHHILYERHTGGPKVFDLCGEHHSWVTRAQSHAGRKQRFELTEKQRWFFWFKLINGQMKRPRNTALDREWREQEQPR
jgi:hypothetical protein